MGGGKGKGAGEMRDGGGVRQFGGVGGNGGGWASYEASSWGSPKVEARPSDVTEPRRMISAHVRQERTVELGRSSGAEEGQTMACVPYGGYASGPIEWNEECRWEERWHLWRRRPGGGSMKVEGRKGLEAAVGIGKGPRRGVMGRAVDGPMQQEGAEGTTPNPLERRDPPHPGIDGSRTKDPAFADAREGSADGRLDARWKSRGGDGDDVDGAPRSPIGGRVGGRAALQNSQHQPSRGCEGGGGGGGSANGYAVGLPPKVSWEVRSGRGAEAGGTEGAENALAGSAEGRATEGSGGSGGEEGRARRGRRRTWKCDMTPTEKASAASGGKWNRCGLGGVGTGCARDSGDGGVGFDDGSGGRCLRSRDGPGHGGAARLEASVSGCRDGGGSDTWGVVGGCDRSVEAARRLASWHGRRRLEAAGEAGLCGRGSSARGGIEADNDSRAYGKAELEGGEAPVSSRRSRARGGVEGKTIPGEAEGLAAGAGGSRRTGHRAWWRRRRDGGGRRRDLVAEHNVPCVTPLAPLLPETGKLWPRNHRRSGTCGGRGCGCWTCRGVGTHRDAACAPIRGFDGRVQMHHPCEPPYPGRGCAGWIRPASEDLVGVRPTDEGGGGGGGGVEAAEGAAAPKPLLQHDRRGWVQLHHLPRESPREGRGCGVRKRPASGRRASGRRRLERRWMQRMRRRRRHQALARGAWLGQGIGATTAEADWAEELAGQGREGDIAAPRKGIRAGEDRRRPRRKSSAKEGGRIGEARNPGPVGNGGGEDRGEASVVDEAWARVREDSSWTPAWKAWSRQVVRGVGRDGSLDIDLVPPAMLEDEPSQRREEPWEDEDLEEFMQRCELEAGLIQEVDSTEAGRRAEDWRRMEEEATMAGISCPRVEEQRSGGSEAAGQDPRAAETWSPPQQVPRPGQNRRPEGGRKRRQKWRPLNFQGMACGPTIEETEGPHLGADRAAEPIPMQRRPARTSENRPRGRRQRGAPSEQFEVEVLTFNGSGAPQALAALELLGQRSRRVAAVLLQEHHARGDAVADLQHGARKCGFKLAPSEASAGRGGGPSAGVAIAAPLHRGWGGLHGPCWDLSPPNSPGRIVGAWIQAGPRGGLAVFSLYLWTSEGMTRRNVALVETALAAASACGCAWLLGADWNATPRELREAVGTMLDRAGAVIRAPSEATCYPPTGHPKVLDYFVVDSRMADAVSEAQVAEEIAGSPHRAVRVVVKGKEVGGLVQMVRKPRMFPRERPIGCPRRPLVPGGGGGREGEEGQGRDNGEEQWRDIAYCIEAELCRECDRVDGDGAPDRRYMGRGEGLQLVRRPLMPPRTAARHGRADGHLHKLAWTLNRMEELVHLAGKGEGGWGDETRRMQWERVAHALGKRDGCPEQLAAAEDRWKGMIDFARGLRGRPRQGGLEAREWAGRLREAIELRKRELGLERRARWKAWIKDQIRRGGEHCTRSQKGQWSARRKR